MRPNRNRDLNFPMLGVLGHCQEGTRLRTGGVAGAEDQGKRSDWVAGKAKQVPADWVHSADARNMLKDAQ